MKPRKQILIATFGSFGDVILFIGLALGLKDRGHNPVIAAAEFYRTSIEPLGIGFRPIRPDVAPNEGDILKRIMDAKKGTEFLLREILMPALRDSYADLNDAAADADLILTHPATYAAPLVAEKRKMRWISTALAPLTFFSLYDLPVFPPFPQLVHLRKIPGMPRLLMHFARAVTRRWSVPVQQLRSELGLPPGADPIYEGQFSPQMTLCLFSRVLASPQPDWPPNSRITGQIFYDSTLGEKLQPELEEFLASGSPPVVFTLGTAAVGAAGDFYRESVKAVERLGMRAVLLIGSHKENRPASSPSKDILVIDRAPHSLLFPRALVNVISGGIGTTAQALRAGRPMLVVPFAHDQPDNAYRVRNLGVAQRIHYMKYNSRRAGQALAELARNESYFIRAKEIADIIRAEDGVGAACDAIEMMLAGV